MRGRVVGELDFLEDVKEKRNDVKKSDRSGTSLFEKEKARKAFQRENDTILNKVKTWITNVNICLFVYSDDIIVVLTHDKNIFEKSKMIYFMRNPKNRNCLYFFFKYLVGKLY